VEVVFTGGEFQNLEGHSDICSVFYSEKNEEAADAALERVKANTLEFKGAGSNEYEGIGMKDKENEAIVIYGLTNYRKDSCSRIVIKTDNFEQDVAEAGEFCANNNNLLGYFDALAHAAAHISTSVTHNPDFEP
jgi:hypothetical protein